MTFPVELFVYSARLEVTLGQAMYGTNTCPRLSAKSRSIFLLLLAAGTLGAQQHKQKKKEKPFCTLAVFPKRMERDPQCGM